MVSLAAIWGLVSTVAFLYPDRLRRAAAAAGHDLLARRRAGLKVIESVYPRPIDKQRCRRRPAKSSAPPDRIVEHRGTSAVVLAVNLEALIAEAQRADGVIEFVPRVGDFVAVGEPLFLLRGGAAAIRRSQAARAGRVRLGAHDRAGLRRSRSASSSISRSRRCRRRSTIRPPPSWRSTSCIACLRTAGKRHLHDDTVFDQAGRLRVIFRTPDWDDFVQLAYSEIRLYGAENFQIARRLRAMTENLIQTLPEHRHAALRRELDLLDRAVGTLYALPGGCGACPCPRYPGPGRRLRGEVGAAVAHSMNSRLPASSVSVWRWPERTAFLKAAKSRSTWSA